MQIITNGFIQGLLFGLVGLGFAMIYNSTGIFHIAQGAIFSLIPFIVWSAIQNGLHWATGVTLAVAVALVLSVTMEAFNHWPLQKREASQEIHLISSLGVYIVIVQLVAVIWGNETRVLRSGIDETFSIGEVIITKSQLLGAVISILILLAFFIWVRRTDLGLRLRALSDNPVQLSLMGYDIRRLRILVFALSGLFTALAAILIATDVGFDPHGGLTVVLLAIVATIIGGRGSFIGPVVGGIMLGIIRAQVTWYTSARWEEAATFLLLVLFLFFRPQGIFGRNGRVEAQ
ncbi:MAG: branched-chain amino acid ABC transporter permease [Ignavibacteriales bacterium]|nr:branched-chain amino acid ABC transporter permease [Ignavibacteriales bacterium]